MKSHIKLSTIENLSTGSALLYYFGKVLATKLRNILRLLWTLQKSSIIQD